MSTRKSFHTFNHVPNSGICLSVQTCPPAHRTCPPESYLHSCPYPYTLEHVFRLNMPTSPSYLSVPVHQKIVYILYHVPHTGTCLSAKHAHQHAVPVQQKVVTLLTMFHTLQDFFLPNMPASRSYLSNKDLLPLFTLKTLPVILEHVVQTALSTSFHNNAPYSSTCRTDSPLHNNDDDGGASGGCGENHRHHDDGTYNNTQYHIVMNPWHDVSII